MSQINMYEARLSKLGVGPKSNDWNGKLLIILDINGNDPDEMMMRNTYLNGLQGKSNNDSRSERSFFGSSKKVNWNDINSGKKDALIQTTFHVDLFIQKELKPVLTHKKLRPSKSIIKGRSNSLDVRRSNNMMTGNIAQQKGNYISNQNYTPMYNNNDVADKGVNNNNRVNNFAQNNHINPPPRSFSVEQKADNRKNNLMNNFQDKDTTTNIQIITPNVNSIINNNYNNIYIQSPTEMDFKKLNQIYSPETQNKLANNMMMNNPPISNNQPLMNNRLSSAGRKDNQPLNSNTNLNSYNYNPKNNFISSNLNSNQPKNDMQKVPNNLLMNSYDPKQIKVIDYSNNNTFIPQTKNSNIFVDVVSNFNNYNSFGANQQKPISNSTNISTEKPKVY
jgi:hypothetical protein